MPASSLTTVQEDALAEVPRGKLSQPPPGNEGKPAPSLTTVQKNELTRLLGKPSLSLERRSAKALACYRARRLEERRRPSWKAIRKTLNLALKQVKSLQRTFDTLSEYEECYVLGWVTERDLDFLYTIESQCQYWLRAKAKTGRRRCAEQMLAAAVGGMLPDRPELWVKVFRLLYCFAHGNRKSISRDIRQYEESLKHAARVASMKLLS